jgi:undecaprenyl-diphosphatase
MIIFSVLVHFATVLSTLIVFRKDIIMLFKDLFEFKFNTGTKYILLLAISLVPVGIVGIFFADNIEFLFEGRISLVGAMLIVTAALLALTHYSKDKSKEVNYFTAFLIGIAQAIAVVPGISRSGATISTALLLNIKKEEAARFSFLMVIVPICGAALLEMKDFSTAATSTLSFSALIAGFIAAFASGLLACTLMLKIVKKGKLIYFALYCLLAGITAIIFA